MLVPIADDLDIALDHADLAHAAVVKAIAHYDLARRRLAGVRGPEAAELRREVSGQLRALAWTATADPGGGVA